VLAMTSLTFPLDSERNRIFPPRRSRGAFTLTSPRKVCFSSFFNCKSARVMPLSPAYANSAFTWLPANNAAVVKHRLSHNEVQDSTIPQIEYSMA
jgi:hypothetical protein